MANNSNNPKTPEQQTAVMMKSILEQLGYLNNTFGDMRNTLDEIAVNGSKERDRLTNAMSKVLESLGKLGPEIRVAMKEAKNSEDILDALNKALHGNRDSAQGSNKQQEEISPILKNLLDSVENINTENEVRIVALMKLMQDNQTDYKASFTTLGDRITKSIEEANQALINNTNSSNKSTKNLLGNKEDRDRIAQKGFLDKLSTMFANSKPVKSAKNALVNFLEIGLLNAASQTNSNFKRKLYIGMVKAGVPDMVVSALGLVIASAFAGPMLKKLVGGQAGKTAGSVVPKIFGGKGGKWAQWQKNYARDLRNARFATTGTNATSNVMAVKEAYAGTYRTATVGGKAVTQGVKGARTMATAAKVGKGLMGGAKALTGGLVGYLAGETLGAGANLAVGMGANAKVAHGLSGAGQGAIYGATLGSVIPGLGTAVGAGVGAAVGGVAGLIKGHYVEQEKKQLESNKLQKEQLKETKEQKGFWQKLKFWEKDKEKEKKKEENDPRANYLRTFDSGGFNPTNAGSNNGDKSNYTRPDYAFNGDLYNGKRAQTSAYNRATVDAGLSKNPYYSHLGAKSSGANRLYKVANTFNTDSKWVQNGMLQSFNAFLASPQGKKWVNKVSITSGTKVRGGAHSRLGDHDGGIGLDFDISGYRKGSKEYKAIMSSLNKDMQSFGLKTIWNTKGHYDHIHATASGADLEKRLSYRYATDSKGRQALIDTNTKKVIGKYDADASNNFSDYKINSDIEKKGSTGYRPYLPANTKKNNKEAKMSFNDVTGNESYTAMATRGTMTIGTGAVCMPS